jgi:hypothetical protein
MIAGILAGTGCGKSKSKEEKLAEQQLEAATGGDADVDISEKGAKMTLTTDEGTMKVATGENASIPENFPKDIPVYKGAEVQTAMQIPEGFSLILFSKDDVDTVVSATESEVAGNGWESVSTLNMGPQTMLSYKKEKRVLSIIIGKNEEDGNTMITINTHKGE